MVIDLDTVTDWRWSHFKPSEFRCAGSGKALMEPSFMDRLQKLRARLGFPFVISSGYRSPGYNAAVSSTGESGPHTLGRAVDILADGERALALLTWGQTFGFTGFGLRQHGAHGARFVHLDDLERTPFRPRPWVWSYA